ncbi:MAG: class I mannose-6-phosphate isomerase [Lachnospiraceae bacterium]|nr:class I mannose-6-phosphate isomerase [Lachnospiraceae bacterium]
MEAENRQENSLGQVIRPLRLDHPRAWRTYLGGRMLDQFHGVEPAMDGHFPEEWIMSLTAARNAGREEFEMEGMSRIVGDAGGRLLKEYIEACPEACLGACFRDTGKADTGVLVKLIDAAERLTVQVHPDRETAKALFQSEYGKTECWHILGGRQVDGQEPCIYIGFQPGITRERWKSAFDRQDIPEMLSLMHRFAVQPGETILIQGGVPHAIGAGCFLVEIQEPTDYTIRIERTTPAGLTIDDRMCHQGLGFDRMFDCFHYDGVSREEARKRWWIEPRTLRPGIRQLIGAPECRYFTLCEIAPQDELSLSTADCFYGLYVLEGSGQLSWSNGRMNLEKGDPIFVSAQAEDVQIQAKAGEKLRVLQFSGGHLAPSPGLCDFL